MVKNIIITLFFLVLIACGKSEDSSKSENVVFSDVVVMDSGVDEENAFCKNFKLTNEQAVSFFKRSHLISTKIMHDKYDYLPCYVKGTSKIKDKKCNWEIRAGGTSEISCSDTNYILACDKCDDLLKDSQ